MKKRNQFSKALLIGALMSITSLQAQHTERVYLSGRGAEDQVKWDFKVSSGMQSGSWKKIVVPSCWELQGFGHYNYGHDPLEERVNEYGLYRHEFEVPQVWDEQEVRLVFEGVMTDADVQVNGQSAGALHQGAFYEFNYVVTDLLKPNQKNLLEVKVNKASANMSINHAERKADFWIFGGIYRPVYLEIMPKNYIDRVAIDAQADGDVIADIYTSAPLGKGVSLELQDLQGKRVEKLKLKEMKDDQGKWHVKARAKDVKTWNPEQPHLYQLAITLTDAKDKALHQVKERIGFRTVEVLEGDGIYVNGEKIKFKGVNRHSFHPATGRTTSAAHRLRDALMIKDMNMNAVRMSHYPPDKHFLDLCDSIGFFVINEVCTWHTPKLDTEVGRKIVKETVVRDVNHPSILLWANGNETGWNTELDDDYPKWDIQKREVIHPWNAFRKMNTLHYPLYYGTMNDARSQDQIMFHTEFLHGLYDGGHGAGLEDFWNVHWYKPIAAGGFLWCFADEAVVRTDKGGILDTDGNHAADGIVGPYGEKEGSYLTIKEIWSPIFIEDRFIRPDFNGVFRVENRYHYTNLNACRMEAKWIHFESPRGPKGEQVMAAYPVALPNLKPNAKGTFSVSRPLNWKQADALHLTAYDPMGKQIFTWSYPVQKPASIAQGLVNYPKGGKVVTSQQGKYTVVKAGEMAYTFDNQTGMVETIKRGNRLIPLTKGPLRLDQHKAMQEEITQTISEIKDGSLHLTYVYKPSLLPQQWVSEKTYKSDTTRWVIHPSGLVDLEVVAKNRKRVIGYKGVTFSYPEDQVKGMKWLGDGPYRVWRNRMKGTRFQVWENDYNNTITGESGFVYPEFKGFYSSLYWVDVLGKQDNGFLVYNHTPHVFLRMFSPGRPADFKRMDPVFDQLPKGDISFVMNIPAVPTKFQNAEETGPHGALENFYGNYDENIVIKLTFDFRK